MPKTFLRIESGKKIAGVCMGLARYFNVDVTLVRVLFVVLVLTSVGSAALAYLILWIVAPVDRTSMSLPNTATSVTVPDVATPSGDPPVSGS